MRLAVALWALLAVFPSAFVQASTTSNTTVQYKYADTELTGDARIRDGGTIIVAGVTVGLNGLYCPKPGTKRSYSAALAIEKLTRNETVTCRLNGEREYDRLVGRCSVSDKDIGASLIAFGYCSRCPRFDPSGSYINAQRRAGHWKDVVPRYCR